MNNKEIELKFGYDGKADNLFETFSKIGNVSAESEQQIGRASVGKECV